MKIETQTLLFMPLKNAELPSSGSGMTFEDLISKPRCDNALVTPDAQPDRGAGNNLPFGDAQVHDLSPDVPAATHVTMPDASEPVAGAIVMPSIPESPTEQDCHLSGTGVTRDVNAFMEPSLRLFGFDALGLLGMGGIQAGGSAVTPDVADAEPLSNDARLYLPGSEKLSRPSLPYVFLTVVAASAASEIPAEDLSTNGTSLPLSVTDSSNTPRPYSSESVTVIQSDAAGFTELSEEAAMPPYFETAVVQVSPPPTVVRGRQILDAGQEATDPAQGPLRSLPWKARFAASTSGRVSVTVSTTDSVLNVFAAAPELSDDVRQKLRGIARDIIHDAGSRLGDFTFNGTSVPEFYPFLRSASWLSQR